MWSEFSHPLSSSPIRLPFLTQALLSGCIHTCVFRVQKQYYKSNGERKIFIHLLFKYFSQFYSTSNILATFAFKVSPKWKRWIIFLSFMRVAKMKVMGNFLFNLDKEKTTTKQPSVGKAGSLIWHIKGERHPWVGSQGRNMQTYFACIWLAGCLVLLHICLSERCSIRVPLNN